MVKSTHIVHLLMNQVSGTVHCKLWGFGEVKFWEKFRLRRAKLLGQLHSIPLSTFAGSVEKFEELGELHLTIEERYRKNLRNGENVFKEFRTSRAHTSFLWLSTG